MTDSLITDTSDRDERHLARMLRKKAVIDERIANSPNECGLLLVLSGNGKGKSSSAFGMLARSMGHGMQCGVVQFPATKTCPSMHSKRWPRLAT